MECRVLIKDADFQQFDWCKYDVANNEVVESGSLSLDELKKSCSGSQRVIVFLPQQDIFLTSHQFPQKPNKAQLNAIAYSIEDAIGQDIEQCFFSTGLERPDHSVPVAIISRQRMDEVAELINDTLNHASLVFPSIYLCPWSNDSSLFASVCAVEQGYLIRYGEHSGVFCAAEALPQTLKLLVAERSAEAVRIDLYAKPVPELQLKGIEIDYCGEIKLLEQDLQLRDAINLKQKEYQSSYQLLESLKNWNWPLAAAAMLLIAVFTNHLLEYHQKNQQLLELQSKQMALIEQYLPQSASNENPKRQIIKALSSAQNGISDAGFVDLLHEFISLKSSFNALSANRVQYQQSKLIVNLESKDLGSMEAFRDKLAQSNFPASIEDVSISPNKTIGRLIMQGS